MNFSMWNLPRPGQLIKLASSMPYERAPSEPVGFLRYREDRNYSGRYDFHIGRDDILMYIGETNNFPDEIRVHLALFGDSLVCVYIGEFEPYV